MKKKRARAEDLTEKLGLVAHSKGSEEAFRNLSDQLSALIGSLDTTCKDAEPDFLKLGQKLEAVYLDATVMGQQTLETVKHIGGESDQSVLVKVEWLAKKSLAELRHCGGRISGSLDHVSDVIEYLSDLHRICNVVEKIAMSLRVIGLNVAVESSRSTKSLDMFAVVFQQIYALSENIVTVAGNISQDAETTRATQRYVHEDISKGLDQLRKLSDDAQRTVESSVREIERLMEFSLEALEAASIHTGEISQQVGEIVAAIQIHDSMSQRVTHIITALRDIEHFCTQGMGDRATTEKSGIAYAIADLQCAQLTQTIAEIDHVHQKSVRAFERIHSEIDKLTQSYSSFGAADTGAGPVEFESLQSALTHLREIIDQGYRLANQLQGTAEKASESTRRLEGYADHVRKISFETHLVALNAIVKAAHLGEAGNSLEVLAQEVKILSDRSNGFVADVTEILQAVSKAVREIYVHSGDVTKKSSFLKKKAADEEQPSGDVNAYDVGLHDISDAYEHFRANSLDAVQIANVLKSAISEIISDLGFLPALARDLTHDLRHLEEITRMLSFGADQKTSETTTETKKLVERYTMQQERSIHEQIILRPDNRIHAKDELFGEKKDDDAEEDDFGDNVELF